MIVVQWVQISNENWMMIPWKMALRILCTEKWFYIFCSIYSFGSCQNKPQNCFIPQARFIFLPLSVSHKQCWYFLVSDDLVQMLDLFIEFRAQYRVDITRFASIFYLVFLVYLILISLFYSTTSFLNPSWYYGTIFIVITHLMFYFEWVEG